VPCVRRAPPRRPLRRTRTPARPRTAPSAAKRGGRAATRPPRTRGTGRLAFGGQPVTPPTLPRSRPRAGPQVVRPPPPAREEGARKVYSVSRVVERAAAVLRERAPQPLWVRGEVSGFSRQRRSGHCYFRLKDGKAEIECVLWCEQADALPALPS